MRTAGSAHWAEDYERGRPGYPAGVVEVAQVPEPATVLDLGAGTGKLTRVLLDRFARVIAVEPAPDMRRLATLSADAQVLGGRAEQIPLANGSVDAVFAAESFHWFDNERALVEIARVLRPGGTLMLMWNLPAGPTMPSIAAVEKHLDERRPDHGELGHDPLDLNPSRYASGQWRAGFAHSAFEELREVRLRHEQAVDSEELLAFFASMGWIANLPRHHRARLLDGVKSRLAAGGYRRPWETRVHWTRVATSVTPYSPDQVERDSFRDNPSR